MGNNDYPPIWEIKRIILQKFPIPENKLKQWVEDRIVRSAKFGSSRQAKNPLLHQ